jgi:hypothetical protein
MKSTIMKHNTSIFLVAFAISLTVFLQSCTKTNVETVYKTDALIESVIIPNSDVPVPLNFVLDTTFNNEKSHSNVNWKSRYFDFSDTWLTGRFGEFHFVPDFSVPSNKLGGVHCAMSKGVQLKNLNFNEKYPADQFWSTGPNTQGPPCYFRFNASDLSKNYLKFYVLVSTMNTSEPGRDGYIQCGQSYMGTQFMDSTRRVVDPTSDTCWLVAQPGTWKQQGNGYVFTADFTFNRYLHNTPGKNDGDPITKPVNVYLSYNGSYDFLTAGGPAGTLRCGFSASFSFLRSDYFDKTATKLYLKNPTAAEKTNSNAAYAINKTYGTYSGSVADQMFINANMVFSKSHQ